ncbi:hypothetical protein BGC33_04025 [Bathymodiolus thermophilus thioautotrophic gill symbiont]|uniref:Uncharacterized protein n=1 Tax=Bathymodiolus thermophilus thioautotrophic gill symbiont TaxID=2360 RepID=A0A1J5U715_9GAMM|nr:hypothetical protein BGC33_04025 [Bathymodiolus thermophilus thioautotrophic gill symbiont]
MNNVYCSRFSLIIFITSILFELLWLALIKIDINTCLKNTFKWPELCDNSLDILIINMGIAWEIIHRDIILNLPFKHDYFVFYMFGYKRIVPDFLVEFSAILVISGALSFISFILCKIICNYRSKKISRKPREFSLKTNANASVELISFLQQALKYPLILQNILSFPSSA